MSFSYGLSHLSSSLAPSDISNNFDGYCKKSEILDNCKFIDSLMGLCRSPEINFYIFLVLKIVEIVCHFITTRSVIINIFMSYSLQSSMINKPKSVIWSRTSKFTPTLSDDL